MRYHLKTQLKKFSYSCTATLTIIDFTKSKIQDHPTKYLVQLVIKLKDISPKGQKKANQEKKFINQDSDEIVYDYTIYIDAGARDKQKTDKNGEVDDRENALEDENDDEDENDSQQASIDKKKKTVKTVKEVKTPAASAVDR